MCPFCFGKCICHLFPPNTISVSQLFSGWPTVFDPQLQPAPTAWEGHTKGSLVTHQHPSGLQEASLPSCMFIHNTSNSTQGCLRRRLTDDAQQESKQRGSERDSSTKRNKHAAQPKRPMDAKATEMWMPGDMHHAPVAGWQAAAQLAWNRSQRAFGPVLVPHFRALQCE